MRGLAFDRVRRDGSARPKKGAIGRTGRPPGPGPKRLTPAELGWSEDDPDRLTMAEIGAVLRQWDKLCWHQARYASRRIHGEEREDTVDEFHGIAQGAFYEGLLRYERSNPQGASPSTYATWWLRNRLREEMAREINRGVRVPSRGIARCVTFFGEARGADDGKVWEAGSYTTARPDMNREERERFWGDVRRVLMPREYTVVEMTYRHKRTGEEVAAAINLSRGRVNQHLAAGMARLRKHAERFRGFAAFLLNDSYTEADHAGTQDLGAVDTGAGRRAGAHGEHPGLGHASRGRRARAALIERARAAHAQGVEVPRPEIA